MTARRTTIAGAALAAPVGGCLAAAGTPLAAAGMSQAATGVATDRAASSGANPAGIDWVPLAGFSIARTETTVGQCRRFVAATGLRTLAAREGGGSVYEAGRARKPGWTWAAPFGPQGPAADDEPAVHLTWREAQAFCRWAGGRLPSDREWVSAAHTEQRDAPPAGFERGRNNYRYPLGNDPAGAQCLGDCGEAARERAIRHGATLSRGHGHARAGTTPPGVNGLHDMGGNAWEWVDEPADATGNSERRTRGGSWWYGAAQMRADHLQGKPADTAVVYIGFRCARDDRGPALSLRPIAASASSSTLTLAGTIRLAGITAWMGIGAGRFPESTSTSLPAAISSAAM